MQGDSGGPLQALRDSRTDTFTVFGITSNGIACGSNPGIYTRVYDYIGWIEYQVWSKQD